MLRARILSFLPAMVCCLSVQVAAAEERAAEVVSVAGEAQVRRGEVGAWRAARVQQPLYAGDYARTGELARLGILFRDETQIRLNQNSLLRVKAVRAAGATRGETRLKLDAGQAWTRSKQVPERLLLETPSATAAIRGTEWDLTVDAKGKTTLTVLAGEVELANDQGRVTVRRDEQATAETGRAPVKLAISNPEDRVQWVTAYALEPLRHISLSGLSAAEAARRLAAGGADAAALVAHGQLLADLGRWAEAAQAFEAAQAQDPGHAGARLGLAFVALQRGEIAQAIKRFDAARVRGADPALLALGRIAAAIGQEQFKTAHRDLESLIARGLVQQPAPWLLLADLAIYGGDLPRAATHCQQGLKRFAGDAQLHACLARVHLLANRLEASAAEIERALARDPSSVEARLARGDLARRRGDEAGALAAYRAALALKPHEHRAWYGLGVVFNEKEDSRQGRRHLSEAIALEPRDARYRGELATLETFANDFARAEAEYTAALAFNPADYVALTGQGLLKLKRGDTEAALADFLRAGLLEPRYARAHGYAAVAYYQLGRRERALEELRRAGELDDKDPLPHQLAAMIHTDHFEPAAAIAEGRESLQRLPFLKSVNQLALNQKGTANLGNAFAFFGLEEWAQHYAQQSYDPYWAGSHLFLGDRYPGLFDKNSEYYQGLLADPTVFGASNRFQTLLPRPGNYLTAGYRFGASDDFRFRNPYATINGFSNATIPTAYFLNVERAELTPRSDFPIEADDTKFTGAIGLAPTEALKLFVFSTADRLEARLENPGFELPVTLRSNRSDLGAHYRFAPDSQLWAKFGQGREREDSSAIESNSRTDYFNDADSRDGQLRHSVRAGAHQLSWGLERARRDNPAEVALYDPADPTLKVIANKTAYDQSDDAYLSERFQASDELLLQGDLYWQRFRREVDAFAALTAPAVTLPAPRERYEDSGLHPRLGLAWQLGENRVLRLAYQDWVRPANVNTLSPVATTGIPLDDRLVGAGGELRRLRAQLEWQWAPSTFSVLFLDHERVHNVALTNSISGAPNLSGLDKLRLQSLFNVAGYDVLEGTPEFDRGELDAAGFAVNHLLNRQWSVYARYVFTDSENTGAAFPGNAIPYLPRQLYALGATWISPWRLYVSAQAVHRSHRYQDEANAEPLEAGWSGSLAAYWESADKHWLVNFIADNYPDLATFYGLGVEYRH